MSEQQGFLPGKPWEWPIEELKKKLAATVRTGRQLRPKAWPNGAKVAVCFSVDIDNETEQLASGDLKIPSFFEMANNQYGARCGIERMTRVFDKYDIGCTFFTPAISALLAPKMFDHILRSGNHELAAHGWIHEAPLRLSKDEHRDLLGRSKELLTNIGGKEVTGYRAPLGEMAPHTIPLLEELGFEYNSCLPADDMPYCLLRDDGTDSNVIEIPCSLSQEDGPFIAIENGWSNGVLSPAQVLEVNKDSFDVAYQEGTMLNLVLHPHLTGRRSKMAALERLIVHMKSRPDVWFPTIGEVSRHIRNEFGM